MMPSYSTPVIIFVAHLKLVKTQLYPYGSSPPSHPCFLSLLRPSLKSFSAKKPQPPSTPCSFFLFDPLSALLTTTILRPPSSLRSNMSPSSFLGISALKSPTFATDLSPRLHLFRGFPHLIRPTCATNLPPRLDLHRECRLHLHRECRLHHQ